jgi:hypothetical protein
MEKIHINICLQTLSFRGTAQQLLDISSLDFYLWGNLKPLGYSALIENEETLHQRIFYVCHTIRKRPGTFEGVRQ